MGNLSSGKEICASMGIDNYAAKESTWNELISQNQKDFVGYQERTIRELEIMGRAWMLLSYILSNFLSKLHCKLVLQGQAK